MNYTKKHIIYGLIILTVVIFAILKNEVTAPTQKTLIPQKIVEIEKESQEIKNTVKEKTILLPFTLRMGTETVTLNASGDTLFEILNDKENKITLSGKTYPGLGFFITDINSLHQGNGKNIMYDINGKEASVGISTYVPQKGDIIEFKLK